MTLSNLQTKVTYAGNGTQVDFPIPFPYLDYPHIQVWRRDNTVPAAPVETLLTLGIGNDYVFTGGDPVHGVIEDTITMNVAPTANHELLIKRVVPLTQDNAYSASGPFPASDMEENLDKLTMEVQQLEEEISRTVKTAVTSSTTGLELPDPTANYVVGWNALGDNLVNIDPAQIAAAGGPILAVDVQVVPVGGLSSSDVQSALVELDTDLAAHVASNANPHGVTAAQVGNTVAQWNANQLQGRAIATTAPNNGDGLIWNSSTSKWEPNPASGGGVTSVNSQTGAVVLDTDDVSEGTTNRYFTSARAKAAAVANSITSGVLDVAPSQDAVFVALAGKVGTGDSRLTDARTPTGSAGGDLTGTYPNPTIAGNAVTYAKMQNVSGNNKLLGRATTGAGLVEEITLGTNLSLTGSTLNASGAAAITIKDEGVTLTSAPTAIDFVGAGVTATNVSGAVTVTIPGASSITAKDEGVNLTTAMTSIDFVGSGVTATNTSGAVTVSVPGVTGISNPSDTVNLGVAATVASNALTLAIKQANGSSDPTVGSPVVINFRSSTLTSGAYNSRTISSALSVTIPAGGNPGHANGVSNILWLYALDNAGTVELAFSTVPFSEHKLQSTTAIGSGVTSNRILYSTTARTNVPIRLLAMLKSTQTTAGTWAAVPTEIDLNVQSALLRNPITCSAVAGAGTAMAINTWVVIAYNTKEYDPYNIFSTSTSKATIPLDGKYQVHVRDALQNLSSTSLFARIVKAGTAVIMTKTYTADPSNTNYPELIREFDLAAGDTLEFQVQNNGGTLTTFSGADATVFRVTRIGD